MQNVAQGTTSDSQKSHEKQQSTTAAAAPAAAPAANVHHDGSGKTSSTPQSSNSSPTKSETETFSELQPRFMTDSSESEEDSVSEVNAVNKRRATLMPNVDKINRVCTMARNVSECVCVCVREREREKERKKEREDER